MTYGGLINEKVNVMLGKEIVNRHMGGERSLLIMGNYYGEVKSLMTHDKESNPTFIGRVIPILSVAFNPIPLLVWFDNLGESLSLWKVTQ